MTDVRKEERDLETDFKNKVFEAFKNAGHDVSMDENGFIVIPRRPSRKRKGEESGKSL